MCYGILENLAGSVAGLLDLLRVLVLAGLYERARHLFGSPLGFPNT